jgi:hypothetical protein
MTLPVKDKGVLDIVDKCVILAEKTSHIKFFDYQKRIVSTIVRALLEEQNEVVVFGARQIGKTACVGSSLVSLMIILPFLANQESMVKKFPVLEKFKKGIFIGLFTPQYEQGYTMFSYVVESLKNENVQFILSDIEEDVEQIGNEVVISNGSILRLRSAHPSVKLESKTYHLVILDEAQDFTSERVRKVILPMLAFYNGTLVRVGVPGFLREDFYERISFYREKKRKPWWYIEINWKEAAKENKLYKSFVKNELKRYGTTDPFFLMSYELVWDAAFERPVSEEALEKCFVNKDIDIYKETDRLFAGIDIGKVKDRTVVSIGKLLDEKGKDDKNVVLVLLFKEFKGDYERQYQEVLEFLKSIPNLARVGIDATSYGSMFADRLDYDLPSVIIDKIVFNQYTKNELSEMFLSAITFGRLKIVKNKRNRVKEFKEEVISLERRVSGGKMVLEGKEHDDYVYSVALLLKQVYSETPEDEVKVSYYRWR